MSAGRILVFTKSKNDALIRLTEKQWEHIVVARPELGDFMKEILLTVEEPGEVFEPLQRKKPQLHAIKKFEKLSRVGLSQNLLVVYRETTLREGVIIAAFPISDRRKRRMYRLWRKLLI